MTPLKPCPFCGGQAVGWVKCGGINPGSGPYFYLWCGCTICGAQTSATSTGTDPDSPDFVELYESKGLVDKWNRRTTEEA